MPHPARPANDALAGGVAERHAASLARHAPFSGLLRSRSRFVIGSAAILLTFNLLQPILSVFTSWLDQPAIGALSVGWVYAFAAFAQFVVPLGLLHLYTARAQKYDAACAAITARLPPAGG